MCFVELKELLHLTIKPKAKEAVVSVPRIPACVDCNIPKGSEVNWIAWFQKQEFYNKAAQECIEEWILNTRLTEESYEDDTNNRTEVCLQRT